MIACRKERSKAPLGCGSADPNIPCLSASSYPKRSQWPEIQISSSLFLGEKPQESSKGAY